MSPYTTNLENLRNEFRRLDVLLKQAIQQFSAIADLVGCVNEVTHRP